MIVNILPLGESYDSKEAGSVALTISDIMRASDFGFRTIVLGSKDTSNPLTSNFRHINFHKGIFESKGKAYIKACIDFIKKNKVSFVELHNKPSQVSLLTKHLNIPVCLHLHSNPLTLNGSRTVRERKKLLKQSEVIYCTSKFIRSTFLEGINDLELHKKIKVIHNITFISKDIDLNRKQKLVIYVGRISHEKGVAEFVKSFLQIANDFPDWKALVIGAPSDISMFDNSYSILRKAVAKHPQQIIHFYHQPYQDTLDWFKEAAIAVVPSKWQEPCGRTVLESISNGCALVTTNKGGIPEIAADASVMLSNAHPDNIVPPLRELMKHPEILYRQQERSISRAKEFIDDFASVKKLDAIRRRIIG